MIPYPAYKPSGIEWLGEIPGHWEVQRLKYVTGINTDALPEDTDPDYVLQYVDISSVDSTGAILETQEMRFESAPSRARRKTRQNDTIISTVRTYLKAIAFIDNQPDNLIASTGFAILRPHLELDPKYLWRWVQSQGFVDAVVVNSEGIGYPAITSTRLGELPALIPPLPEQCAIATYLDDHTARLDTAIAESRRLIAHLRERRAALISHTVTQGLDPNAPRKDSGIEWLGEIPSHWEAKRLRFIATIQTGVAKGRDLGNKEVIEVPYLRVANVQNGFVDLSDVATIEIGIDEIERYSLQIGDILMTEGGDYDKLGRGTVWEGQIRPCIHQNHVFAVRVHRGINPYWISLLTQADYARHYFILRSKQSTNLASISGTNIMEFPVIFPPIPEQRAIAAYLDRETARLDAAIAEIEALIAHLEEYRAALIAAAVTGKINVC